MDLRRVFGFDEGGAEEGAVLYALLGFPFFFSFFFFFDDACGGRRRRRRRLGVEVTALAEPEAGAGESVARVEICVVEGGVSGRGEVGGAEETGEVGGVEREFLFDFEEGHCFGVRWWVLFTGRRAILLRCGEVFFSIVRELLSCWKRNYRK